MNDYAQAFLTWLADTRDVFGVTAQNWMLIFGAGVLLYIVVLAARSCR
ncbi:MAG: hypothetical protein WDN48_11750 [Pseudolabrys sp.]